MRTDKLLLQDILWCCEEALAFIKGFNESSFIANNLVRSGVQMKLLIVGEAASRLSDSFKNSHAEVPWKKIIAYRNFAAHAYFMVDSKQVWETVSVHLPLLRDSVAAILAKDFSA